MPGRTIHDRYISQVCFDSDHDECHDITCECDHHLGDIVDQEGKPNDG
jgi:hypothetical protein